MSDTSVETSNPAKDLLSGIRLVAQHRGASFEQKLSTFLDYPPWSKEYYHGLKLLMDNIECLRSDLLSITEVDNEDRDYFKSEISRLERLFTPSHISCKWEQNTVTEAPFGPEVVTFLRSSSGQLRRIHSYKILSDTDVKAILHAIECIRSDMSGVTLENSDFAREALLRGCNEVAFILSKIDLYGFSRLEAPVMELGAFLFTVSEEIQRIEGSKKKIQRSSNALSNAMKRMRDLAIFVNAGKALADGATFLIDHVQD